MQSGPKPGHNSFQVIDGTVARLDAGPAVPRRRWSAAAKEPIVAEALAPGVNVSAVARSHGLSPQQVFAWRRQAVRRARHGGARSGGTQQDGAGVPGTAFAEVRVTGTSAVPEGSIEPVAAVVELMIGDVRLRVGPSVPASWVRDLLRSVRSA